MFSKGRKGAKHVCHGSYTTRDFVQNVRNNITSTMLEGRHRIHAHSKSAASWPTARLAHLLYNCTKTTPRRSPLELAAPRLTAQTAAGSS
mmetsp:Transcript_48671/g.155516  ORF Transcript_48671/g.155516 Transcript_48671/m.155516 type:complete len:90 (+) Transcript_48671:308-577(+)